MDGTTNNSDNLEITSVKTQNSVDPELNPENPEKVDEEQNNDNLENESSNKEDNIDLSNESDVKVPEQNENSLAVNRINSNKSSKSEKSGNGGLLVPGQKSPRATTAKSVIRGKHKGTWYSQGIPPPSTYKKPDKVTLRDGREQLAVMDEERKAALSRKMLIICAIVGTIIIVVIIITAAVIAALPEPVVISEVPESLRKFDANEVALLPTECTINLIGNGQCDWEIQNNPHGQCDYDRKDCRESQECLELPKLLNAKDGDEKCIKGQEWSYSYPQCDLDSTEFCS